MQLRGELVTRCNDNRKVGRKETINVFQGPVGSLGIEEVRDWDEREADDGPNNPESPLKVLNTGQSDLNDQP